MIAFLYPAHSSPQHSSYINKQQHPVSVYGWANWVILDEVRTHAPELQPSLRKVQWTFAFTVFHSLCDCCTVGERLTCYQFLCFSWDFQPHHKQEGSDSNWQSLCSPDFQTQEWWTWLRFPSGGRGLDGISHAGVNLDWDCNLGHVNKTGRWGINQSTGGKIYCLVSEQSDNIKYAVNSLPNQMLCWICSRPSNSQQVKCRS